MPLLERDATSVRRTDPNCLTCVSDRIVRRHSRGHTTGAVRPGMHTESNDTGAERLTASGKIL